MDEYIKRKTAVRAVMAAKWVDGSDGAMAMEIVASLAAADVVPVVRCRECIKSGVTDGGQRYCTEPLGLYGALPVKDEGFCSNGKREGT